MLDAKNVSKLPKKIKVPENKIDTIQAQVKKIVKPWMDQNNIPGVAIALHYNGESYLLHYGYADRENKKAVTEKTVFEIGSLSKVFTCLLVAQEILAGKMRLTEPITTYIPALADNKKLRTTTIEKLCTHTATMPFDAPNWVLSPQAFTKFMNSWKPTHPNQLCFQYSNPGIELLRIALEEVHHDTINNLFIKKILVPLHMSPISIEVPKKYMPHYSYCINKKNETARYWDDPILHASGGVRATSADMLKFLKAALCLPGTPDSILSAMQLTQKPYISVAHIYHGLGWEIKNLDNLSCKHAITWGFPAQKITAPEQLVIQNSILEKTGTTRGFHAYIGIMPGTQNGIVIMMNRALQNGRSSIKKTGRKILFELKQ
jgi:beta-lactamase class C